MPLKSHVCWAHCFLQETEVTERTPFEVAALFAEGLRQQVEHLAQHPFPYAIQPPHLQSGVLAIRDIWEGASPAESTVFNLGRHIAYAFCD